jgi:hypothetical protein
MVNTTTTLHRVAALPQQLRAQAIRIMRRGTERRQRELENSRLEILCGLDVVESDWGEWEDTVASFTPR